MKFIMISFQDIFKKSFTEGAAFEINIANIMMALIASFLCGMIIYFVYRKFYKGVIYNNNFNILLILVCIITTFIVLTITSNVVLSLGMVGALSIVRFRTAVKDPLDVGFLFWSIAVGITCGAGLFAMSFFCTIFISVIYILLVKVKNTGRVYLLVLQYENEANEEVQKILAKMKYTLKNRTIRKNQIELTLEIKLKGDNTSFMPMLSGIKGVGTATLLEYTGNFAE